jgi:hypothetical protein
MLGCTDAIPIGVTEPLLCFRVINPQWKVLAVGVDNIDPLYPFPPKVRTFEGLPQLYLGSALGISNPVHVVSYRIEKAEESPS